MIGRVLRVAAVVIGEYGVEWLYVSSEISLLKLRTV
jgi:hypothetical protein